jgi:hypothetical protein
MKKPHIVILSFSYAGFANGAIGTVSGEREVVLLAKVGKWAMVKHPRCIPFVVASKCLREIEGPKP